MKSDSAGRLHFTSNATGYELGIYKEGESADLVGVDYIIGENQRYLREGIENKVSIALFNRGEEMSPGAKK